MLDLTRILPFMELALKQAKLALDRLEVPVGCVIVENGRVIATGCNRTSQTRNATRHAEMEAIDVLMEQWQKEGLDSTQVAQRFSACDLYVTCEPCIMCAAALSILGFREVYYGCANDKFGGCGSILSLHEGASPEFSSHFLLKLEASKTLGRNYFPLWSRQRAMSRICLQVKSMAIPPCNLLTVIQSRFALLHPHNPLAYLQYNPPLLDSSPHTAIIRAEQPPYRCRYIAPKPHRPVRASQLQPGAGSSADH